MKYTYNEKGLTATEEVKIGNDVFRINRTYDSRGNLNQADYYKNNAIYERRKYEYDGSNRMLNVQKAVNGSSSFSTLAAYSYNQNDAIAKVSYGNNTYQTYDYNGDMIKSISLYNKANNKCLEKLEYGYDGDACINRKKEEYNGYITETKYRYDIAGMLTDETVITNGESFELRYGYDSRGNRTSMDKTGYGGKFRITYSYDKNNRLTNTNETNGNDSYQTKYTYDKNGNQIGIEKFRKNSSDEFKLYIEDILSKNNAGSVENFEYNGLDQLVGYENLTGSYNGKQGYNAEYKYMPNGYRLSKNVNGMTTKFLWDGGEVLSELNNANVITKKYYRGMNLISDSSDNYYISDVHGNIIEEYALGKDSPNKWYLYNAFGGNDYFDDTSRVNQNNTWGYCGQYYDFETGNYYMRARYYDPDTGRFITEDPIKDGLNWYAYCGNNPVNYIDPSGLILSTNKENSDYITKMLSLLTGGKANYNNNDGTISCTYDTRNKPVGSQLVKGLIEADEMIFIDVVSDNTNKYLSAENNLKIQAESDPLVSLPCINENGKIQNIETPTYIVFGHELVHAYDDIVSPKENMYDTSYAELYATYKEEFYATGLDFSKASNNTYENIIKNFSGSISENGLRIENAPFDNNLMLSNGNYILRGRYNPEPTLAEILNFLRR